MQQTLEDRLVKGQSADNLPEKTIHKAQVTGCMCRSIKHTFLTLTYCQ